MRIVSSSPQPNNKRGNLLSDQDGGLARAIDEVRTTLMARIRELENQLAKQQQGQQVAPSFSLSGKRRRKKKKQAPEENSVEGHLLAAMDEMERELFYRRKEEYLKEFDLNSSSDYTLLNDILFYEILKLRLMKVKLIDPTVDVDKILLECTDRIQRNLEALGMLRKQRLAQKEQVTTSIADLIAQFDREKALAEREKYLAEEETEFKKKQERDAGIVDFETAVAKFDEYIKQITSEQVNEQVVVEDSGDTEEVIE